MKNAAKEGRDAMRVGRFASRALLVFGGAVAATAAAWALSTTAASADTGTVEAVGVGTSVTPVTDAAMANLGDVNHGVSIVTGDIAGAAVGGLSPIGTCQPDATTWSEPGHSRPACPPEHDGATPAEPVRTTVDHEISGRVSDAVADLGQEVVLQPLQRTLGAAEHIVREPADTRQVIEQTVAPSPGGRDFGRKVWDLVEPGRSGKPAELPALPVPVEPATHESAATSTGEPAQDLGATTVSTTEFDRALYPLAGLARTDVATGSTGSLSAEGPKRPIAPFGPEQQFRWHPRAPRRPRAAAVPRPAVTSTV